MRILKRITGAANDPSNWAPLVLGFTVGVISVLSGCRSTGDKKPSPPLSEEVLYVHSSVEHDGRDSDATPSIAPIEIVNVAYTETIDDHEQSHADDSTKEPESLRELMLQQDATDMDLESASAESSLQSEVPPTTDGLTLATVESIALGSHPDLRFAQAKIASQHGQYVQAGLPLNPVLQYQSEEIGNEDSTGIHSLTVSQQFVTANKLELAQKVEAQRIEKQRAQWQLARLRVLTRVRTAFARAIISQKRLEIAGQIVEIAEKSFASVKELLEADEVSRIELLQAKVETEKARIVAEVARTNLEAQLRSLAAAAGVTQLPAETLAGTIASELNDAPWESLLAEIEATSPELASAGSELQRARWSLALACAQVTPNVTGQLGVGYDAATDDAFAIIGVSVPLPIRNRNQGNLRSARADIAAATAAIGQTHLDLNDRLASTVGRYQVSLQRYRRLRNTVVPDAEESYQLSREAFEAGETGFLQLLTAQRTLFDTQMNVLDALVQAKAAAAEIDGLLVKLP